jgi:hypothetical protein
MSKTAKNSHMFNLSENIIPRSITNLPKSSAQTEHMFAQSELELQEFLTESYSESFKIMDKFWKEGLNLLEYLQSKCYQLKPEYADCLDKEFRQINFLKQFKIGSSASKENYDLVSFFILTSLSAN